MILTHKIRIYPNKTTIKQFEQYFGYSRYCYNKGLNTWEKEYNLGNKPNGRRVRDILKKNKEEWEKELSPQILDTSIEDLERAFQNFFKKRSNYPKFKSKKLAKDTFRYYRKSDSTIRIKGNKLFLPKIKYGIKFSELPRFNGTIKTCTISRKCDMYFASLTIELKDDIKDKVSNDKSIGIDLGLKTFATLAYDYRGLRQYKSVKGIKYKLKPLYKKISYYQKGLSRKIKRSNKYNVMKSKLQKIYYRISCIQKDYLNKLTKLLCKFKYICIEDLNVSGMLKNKKLSKSMHKSLFYTFRTLLEYKSIMYGNHLEIADRWFPSTQTCSKCGNVKINENKLTLKDRTYTCDCGYKEDRDNNAAYNLKLYVERKVGLQP